jgi:hypothetical protein
MRKIIFTTSLAILLKLFLPSIGLCQFITSDEAAIVAQKWIRIVMDKHGSWGGQKDAFIGQIVSLEKDHRLIGYNCSVIPKGFIIISLRKELRPVKFYSTSGQYNSMEVNGTPNLIRDIMYKIVDTLEVAFGSIESNTPFENSELTGQSNQQFWEYILNYVPGTINTDSEGKMSKNSYQPGDFLLDCEWHQDAPYNNYCPYQWCSNTGNGRAPAGCSAIACSQILKYWSWPPGFDWEHIPNYVTTDSSEIVQNAVADLCYTVGASFPTDYDCDGSGALQGTPAQALHSFLGFSMNATALREFYSINAWFNMIKDQINNNRPIYYDFFNTHSIVIDGYDNIIPEDIWVHANYGWADTCNWWYWLDDGLIYHGTLMESMVRPIVPNVSVGSDLSGVYQPNQDFPYRYFDQDAEGTNASFYDDYFQFLPRITVKGTGASSYVKFFGPSLLFTNGDNSRGIQINTYTAAIQMKNGGTVKFYKKEGY